MIKNHKASINKNSLVPKIIPLIKNWIGHKRIIIHNTRLIFSTLDMLSHRLSLKDPPSILLVFLYSEVRLAARNSTKYETIDVIPNVIIIKKALSAKANTSVNRASGKVNPTST